MTALFLRTNRSGTRSLLHLSLDSLMTNFIIQDEYQNPNPEDKTPNPNSETQNHSKNRNPKTQELWYCNITISDISFSLVNMHTQDNRGYSCTKSFLLNFLHNIVFHTHIISSDIHLEHEVKQQEKCKYFRTY